MMHGHWDLPIQVAGTDLCVGLASVLVTVACSSGSSDLWQRVNSNFI